MTSNPFPRRSTLGTLWEFAAWRQLMADITESLVLHSRGA